MKLRKINLVALGLAVLMASAGLKAADTAMDADAQENAMEDLRATLGNMTSQINDMKTKSDMGVSFGINTDLRYDYQKYNTFSAAGAAAPAGGNYYVKSAITDAPFPSGAAGAYAKRVEVEFKGKTASWAQWHLQFEFAALKIEDTGVELNDLSMIPFMDSGSWTWNMKIGLFRQPFGIEPQTGSSSIPFPERAMMYGGANPAGLGKLVMERVLGLHFWQQKDFGPVGYKLQLAVANDVNDELSGQASIKAGFPTQFADPAPSEFGRLGIDLNFIPTVKLNVGGSMIHNSANTIAFDTDAAHEFWYDIFGVDASIDMTALNWKVWGELVESNKLSGVSTANDATPLTESPLHNGILAHAEGWYIVSSMQPLKFFMKDAPAIEINARLESYDPDVNANFVNAPWIYSSEQACTVAIKWSYVGKNYTSINYTTYALNGDFSALNGTSLFVLQQQFKF